jgi:hypothetical protein
VFSLQRDICKTALQQMPLEEKLLTGTQNLVLLQRDILTFRLKTILTFNCIDVKNKFTFPAFLTYFL